jgi:hypothetical protein
LTPESTPARLQSKLAKQAQHITQLQASVDRFRAHAIREHTARIEAELELARTARDPKNSPECIRLRRELARAADFLASGVDEAAALGASLRGAL